MFYFVYVLQCSDSTYYIGCTNNLEKRFNQHNNSKSGAHYTKIRRPVVLKYSEQHQELTMARKREYQLKKLTRFQKEELINKIK